MSFFPMFCTDLTAPWLIWTRGGEKLSQPKSTANLEEGKIFKIKKKSRRIREGLQGFPQLSSLWNSSTKHVPIFPILASLPLHGLLSWFSVMQHLSKQGCSPGCWGCPACGSKLPLTSCHLNTYSCSLSFSVLSFKNSAWRIGRRAYKENKHIFVCSENGNCRIKGICMKSNITDELEADLFFKSKRWRPKGMHCAPLIYQILCSSLFLNFLTLIIYCLSISSHLHLQHRAPFPLMETFTLQFRMLLVSCKDTSGPKIWITAEKQSEWANPVLDYREWKTYWNPAVTGNLRQNYLSPQDRKSVV